MGTLLAGFYLLRVFDMGTATYVAVAINFAVGGRLARGGKHTSISQRGGRGHNPRLRAADGAPKPLAKAGLL